MGLEAIACFGAVDTEPIELLTRRRRVRAGLSRRRIVRRGRQLNVEAYERPRRLVIEQMERRLWSREASPQPLSDARAGAILHQTKNKKTNGKHLWLSNT